VGTNFISHSEKQTRELAQRLVGKYANDLKGKTLVWTLDGEPGIGKTTLVKGLVEILEAPRVFRRLEYIGVSEYAFNLNSRNGRLFHLDLNPIQSEEQVRSWKLDAFLKPQNIVVIESARKAPGLIKQLVKSEKLRCIKISFKRRDEHTREIEYGEAIAP